MLKKYALRYYQYEKSAYEQQFLELRELAEDDPNFIAEYRLLIEESAADIAEKLGELKALVESKKIQDWNFSKPSRHRVWAASVLPAVALHQQRD